MCNFFRTLRADEIDVRAQQVKKNSAGKVFANLLLYKDARVDMTLLDEEFGIFGWQREHEFKDGKLYCRVSVYDKSTGVWVVKEDVGTPSNTEADKGHASDAFKRAAVNLGIGRELYTAPRIIVELAEGEYYIVKDKRTNEEVCRLSNRLQFFVNAIAYDEFRNIVALKIIDNKGRTRIEQGEIHDPLFQAKAEANAARSITEARHVWRKYPEFQSDPGFVVAVKEKTEQYKQSNQ